MLLPAIFNRVAAAAGIALACDVRETCTGRSLVAPAGGVAPRTPLVQTPVSSCLVADSSAELAVAIDAERELGRESAFFEYFEEVVPSDFPTLPAFPLRRPSTPKGLVEDAPAPVGERSTSFRRGAPTASLASFGRKLRATFPPGRGPRRGGLYSGARGTRAHTLERDPHRPWSRGLFSDADT